MQLIFCPVNSGVRQHTHMNPSRTVLLLLIGAQAVAASFAVLILGAAGKRAWLIQALAAGLALLLGFAGDRLFRLARAPVAIIVLTLAGVALTLLHHSPEPHRWISFGPLNLYMATVLIPSFLVVCSVFAREPGSHLAIVLAATVGLSVLLAVQPDAPQALALLVGSMVCLGQSRADLLKSAVTLACVAAATVWAFSRPDSLEPVPHVEGVFALAFSHSPFVGIAVLASAVALVAGLCVISLKGHSWLNAVAAYYAVLFACSVGGMTPAPLIGYGAGPLLGFGLMAGVSRRAETKVSPDNSSGPTPQLHGAA
jgi:hypothetical protein